MTTPTTHQPDTCSHPTCTNHPTMQYKLSDGQGNTLAVFACDTHRYPISTAETGLHAQNCGLFPCNCTPTQPPAGLTAGPTTSHTT